MKDFVYHSSTADQTWSVLFDGELRPSETGACGRGRAALWFGSRPTIDAVPVDHRVATS